ncbi:MAG: N-acetylmuramoyl-L-alanine amidase family protein [Paracoccaceae bacterium]
MSSLFRAILIWLMLAAPAAAQPLSALARVDAAGSRISDAGEGVELRLALSQPVPYALRLLDGPPRLAVEFNEVDWTGLTPAGFGRSGRAEVTAMGTLRQGWSRLMLELSTPMLVERAEMRVDQTAGNAVLALRLRPADKDEFAAHVSPPDQEVPAATPAPRRRQDGTRPLRVVLDPGHGGVDPGAERDGVREADLMLTFARELKEVLRRAGMQVVMTRDADVFVPLETRITVARAAQADLLLSLHADALAEGRATGATVYTLSETASDTASAKLAERHDRADLLAGVDLTRHDDVIADVLMDLARLESTPRSDHLADAVVEGLRQSVGGLHKRPRLSAGFSVLKSPDIPSVLVELGFLSSDRDRARLTDPDWRRRAAEGIRDALQAWAVEDAAAAALLRR